MHFLDDQKPFDKELNDKYDLVGKKTLKEILEASGFYTDIFLRENEMKDGDLTFWDVRGVNSKKDAVYFDVEVKEFWKSAESLPKRVESEGFSFPNRKSITHNPRQSRTNYLVIVSIDLQGAFVVSKEVFENAPIIEKPTKYGTGKFRNILKEQGVLLIKRNGKWQIQS
jgi:hypothetical protein